MLTRIISLSFCMIFLFSTPLLAEVPTENNPIKKCEAGDGASCEIIGLILFSGKGVPVNKSKAMEYFEKGCLANHGSSCHSIAYVYSEGDGVAKDLSKAAIFFEKGCLLKHPNSCFMTGLVHDTANQKELAFKYYDQACNFGSGAGCTNLSSLYFDGKGVTKDDAKAVSFLEKSCQLKDARGCGMLGISYGQGRGVTKDLAKSTTYLKQSCQGGFQPACKMLK